MSPSARPPGRGRTIQTRLLDRLLRRRQRVPFGPTRPTDPPSHDPDEGRDSGGDAGGGAGVREPRRPKPGPSSMTAEADEPEDQYLDLGSSSK